MRGLSPSQGPPPPPLALRAAVRIQQNQTKEWASSFCVSRCAGHAALPGIHASMREPAAFTRAVVVAFGIVFALYAVNAVGGYWRFGKGAAVLVTTDMFQVAALVWAADGDGAAGPRAHAVGSSGGCDDVVVPETAL